MEEDEAILNDKDFLLIGLQLFIVICSFFKVLFFLRIYANFAFLVQMLEMSIFQVFPFLVFFMMWVTLFTVSYQTLKVEISSADEDYPNVFSFIQYFLMTYRNSIGDISAPGY